MGKQGGLGGVREKIRNNTGSVHSLGKEGE